MSTLRKQKNKIHSGNRDYYQVLGRGRTVREEICDLLFRTNFGSERRQKLKEWFTAGGCTHINRRGCIQLKYDPDLQKLLKQGIIKQTREGTFSTKHSMLSLV